MGMEKHEPDFLVAKFQKSSLPSPTVGHDFIQTMGMEIKEGRDFSKDFDPNLEGTRVLTS